MSYTPALDSHMIAQIGFCVNMEGLDLFEIHQTWTDLREARVKDGFIFRVSRYFIDHWLRLLGPKAAWAVVDLQQRCYLEKADHCLASLKDLCAATGVRSTTTMQAIVDEPLMRWFFAKRNTRYRRAGKVMRGKNCYDLQMSDPLTPKHQGQIARLLVERLGDDTVRAIRGVDDLIRLVSDLPSLSNLPADRLPAWATREPLNLRQIALRTLSEAGIDNVHANLTDETALRRAFADVQVRITRPTRIALATHYFRTEWVPQLGATNAWLIMALRSRCYWNKESGEVRDTCAMSTMKLADLLGCSTRTVIRGLQDPLVQRFVTAQGRVYEPRPGDGRKTPARTRFQVHLTLDPLTPPDEEIFAQILLSDATRYGLDPTTGQMNMLDILDMMGQMTDDEITRRARSRDRTEIRAPVAGKSSDKNEIRRSVLHEPVLASSAKNGFGSQLAEHEPVPETESSDKAEIRTLEFEPLLPSATPRERVLENESGDKNEIRGSASDKTEFRADEPSDKIEAIIPRSSDRIEKQYLNTKVNTLGSEDSLQQQQYPAAVDTSQHTLHQILTRYGIEEPALSRILANSQVTLGLARAWMLYADGESRLVHKAGYVVQRLAKTPPDMPSDPDLLLIAGLDDDEWSAFVQRRALEQRMGASVSFADRRREAQYQAWLRSYERVERGKDIIRQDDRGDETAVEHNGGRTSRWQPDVG